ncbi:pentapeptide repeat-containing protein [Chloroflexota bacterium]
MGDGTEQNPFTREDVLRLIEENGGKSEGLDLSGKVFEEGIDLRDLDLIGIVLKGVSAIGAQFEGTYLIDAHLEGAELFKAHFRGTYLSFAHLDGASLGNAHLEGAYLRGAHLQQADLGHCDLRGPDTNLVEANLEGAKLYACDLSGANIEGINWGPEYIVREEQESKRETNKEEKHELLREAASVYRNLKKWYTEQGMYNFAGVFLFREMTVRRKSMAWWPKPWRRAWSKFISLICGYGERPLRVVAWAASVVLGFTIVYFLCGSDMEWWALWKSLYFSAVSFTALGYGSWAGTDNDLMKALGAFESFLGVFSMALFLVTFTRKMTR